MALLDLQLSLILVPIIAISQVLSLLSRSVSFGVCGNLVPLLLPQIVVKFDIKKLVSWF